jgi:hypothetical protein
MLLIVYPNEYASRSIAAMRDATFALVIVRLVLFVGTAGSMAVRRSNDLSIGCVCAMPMMPAAPKNRMGEHRCTSQTGCHYMH